MQYHESANAQTALMNRLLRRPLDGPSHFSHTRQETSRTGHRETRVDTVAAPRKSPRGGLHPFLAAEGRTIYSPKSSPDSSPASSRSSSQHPPSPVSSSTSLPDGDDAEYGGCEARNNHAHDLCRYCEMQTGMKIHYEDPRSAPMFYAGPKRASIQYDEFSSWATRDVLSHDSRDVLSHDSREADAIFETMMAGVGEYRMVLDA